MKITVLIPFVLAFYPSLAILAADPQPAAEDSIRVTVVGTVRGGMMAIGGETTGTTITAKGVVWELDLGNQPALIAAAKKLDGKKGIAEGDLERRPGVEIKERWIVTVRSLKPAGPPMRGGKPPRQS